MSECLSPRTMSECRSGSPNDVRVPFRRLQASPGRSQRTVQPAFRSGQRSVLSVPFSQRTVRQIPERCPSACPRNDVRVLFRLPPGLHQAATRSSPSCLGNDVRVLESPKRCPRLFRPPPEYFRQCTISVVLRAIALSSMRSSEVSVAQAIALSSMRSAEVSVVPEPSH
jgi:hypothetical protein